MPIESASSALIATFAHDLRVPLRSIMMTTQRIQRTGELLNDDTRAKLEQILTAARRQEELIVSVVEYDQALKPGLAGDNLLALRLAIQTACLKVDAYRLARVGTIVFETDAIPRVLVPAGISKVVEKILHNGLKFHPLGNRPKVHVEAVDGEAGAVTIRVSDNGLGIGTAHRELVFEPFQRLNSISDYPGSGLGLSTCRRLLESIGGKIGIEGTAGSTLAVTLPKSAVTVGVAQAVKIKACGSRA